MSHDRPFLEKAWRLFHNNDFEDVIDQSMVEVMDEVATYHPLVHQAEITSALFKYHALAEFKEYVNQLKNDLETLKNA